MPVKQAEVCKRETKRTTIKPKCPNCSSDRHTVIGEDRYACIECDSVFEPDEEHMIVRSGGVR